MSGRSSWLVYQINKNGMCGEHWMVRNFDGTCDGCKYELEQQEKTFIEEIKENKDEQY